MTLADAPGPTTSPCMAKRKTTKRKGLGRGLDALLGYGATAPAVTDESTLRDLPVELIRRGQYQPRSAIDPEGLEALAQSIRSQGILQPVQVRPLADGVHYELLAGERRWRAAQMVGLAEVPAITQVARR